MPAALLQKNSFYPALIFAFSLAAMLPVLIFGVPFGTGDFDHHMQIAAAFYDSMREGVAYPSWVLQENYGYGAVTVRFYPPLLHFSLALFRIVTGDWQFALFGAFAFWTFVGGVGMFLFGREILGSKTLAAASAVIFIFAPYHLNQFYNSFMFGEYVALSILPFGFFFAKRICERGSFLNVAGFAAAICGLILSNLPQAVIGSVCLGFYILLHLRKTEFFSQIIRLSLASFIALSCSAFYWARMAGEMNWIKISQPNTDPNYDFRNHFLLDNFSFDAQGVWFASLMCVAAIVLILLALSFSGKFKSACADKSIRNILLISIFALLMMLPLAKFVWEAVPFLQKVQFPWRFLSILSLGASLMTAFALGFISKENFLFKRPQILLLCGLVLIYLTFSGKQIIFGAAFAETKEFAAMMDSVREKKGLEHWHPVWVNEKTFAKTERVSAEGREITFDLWRNDRREFTVAPGNPASARVNLMFYPHWHAEINGKNAAVAAGEDGSLIIPLSGEQSDVKLYFQEPFVVRCAFYFSAASWILLGLGIFFIYFPYQKSFVFESN